MSSPVITVDVTCKAVDAARIMAKNRIGCTVVVEREMAVGIVTERDLLERILAVGKNHRLLGWGRSCLVRYSPLIKVLLFLSRFGR